jgi:Mn2+/Fe2+ NRAMP family transporter
LIQPSWGFLPNIPEKAENGAEPTDIIISLVGTTSIGFNLFLGGAMAKGKSLRPAQRGIGFSTASAFVVSVLILIVGSGNYQEEESGQRFKIADLANKIADFYGTAGVVIFGIGFISAALSSMLTVPLGAALTADSVFSDDTSENDDTANLQSPFANEKIKGVDNLNFQMENGVQTKKS